MQTTARLDLSIWRNDDVYEYALRVIGPNLTGVPLRAQFRLGPDTPGPALAVLEQVTNGNAQGVRLASAMLVGAVWINDVRIRLNKSTRQALPYAGELGDAAALGWGLQIGGRTRIQGEARILAHVMDSDAAPASRVAGFGFSTGRSGFPAPGATLTIAQDDGATLAIDGADLIVPAAAQASSSAIAAQDARAGADLAAAAAAGFVSGILYPTTAAGLAAVAANAYFSVAGDGANTYAILYRKVNGAAVEQARYASKAAMDAAIAGRMAPDGANVTVAGAFRLRTAVTPGDMQLVMPAGTSVLALINKAMDTAIDAQVPVDLRWPIGSGLWQVDGSIVGSKQNPANPGGEWLRPPEIIGGNCNIVYAGADPIETLLLLRNVSNARMSGVRLNGSGKVKCGIDASYTAQAAPSLGNSFRRIAIENIVPTSAVPGFRAYGNNDSDFHDILVAALDSADVYAVAMKLDAPGGAVRGSQLRVNGGEFVYQAQCLTLLNSQCSGIRAIGNDDNELNLTGGYYYASRTGVNIRIAAGKQIMTLSARTRMENGYNNGRIIAGDNVAVDGSNAGYLNGGLDFYGRLLAPDGSTHNVKLFDASVLARNGPAKARVGGVTTYVDVSSTASMSVLASLWDQPHAVRLEGAV